MINLYRLFIPLLCGFIFTCISCTTYKNVPYFRDYSDTALPQTIKTVTFKSPLIQPDDLLSINIQTLDPISTEAFAVSSVPAGVTSNAISPSHLVDKAGDVELPVIGKVHLQGLTSAEATDTIRNRVAVFYKNPAVDVHFTNFKITIIGEVNRPSSYTIPNEKITILDALGLAGDLTIYGKRENVLLIRDSTNQKQLIRLNLNSKSIIESPYFYLKQNDVVYVEPNNARLASLNAERNKYIAIALSAATVIVLALRYLR